MERKTFLIGGILSLVVVSAGFVAVLFKQSLLSLLLIAAGFISFMIILRFAKKEDWFGKPVVHKLHKF